jgi:translation elongation factor EF-Tu-like GTPase
MISDILEVKARLTLYSPENGGRKTGIKSGYRPNHVFEYIENSSDFITTYIGQIEFNKEWIFPKDTEDVKVKFLKNQNIESLIKKERVWWIHEGPNKIGEAKVLEIISE